VLIYCARTQTSRPPGLGGRVREEAVDRASRSTRLEDVPGRRARAAPHPVSRGLDSVDQDHPVRRARSGRGLPVELSSVAER
jgi:hypothetical protein